MARNAKGSKGGGKVKKFRAPKKVAPKAKAKATRKAASPPKQERKRREIPTQPPLTGMEDMGIPELDEVCKKLHTARTEQLLAKADEDELDPDILRLLHKHGKAVYRAHGMIIALVPGGEKLSKKIDKQKARSSVDSSEQPEVKQPEWDDEGNETAAVKGGEDFEVTQEDVEDQDDEE